MTSSKRLSSLQRTKKYYCFKVSWHFSTFWSITIFLVKVYKVKKVVTMIQSIAMIRNDLFLYILGLKRLFFLHFQVNFPLKIQLNLIHGFSRYLKAPSQHFFPLTPCIPLTSCPLKSCSTVFYTVSKWVCLAITSILQQGVMNH